MSLSGISISLDAMGGDHGPKVVVPAAIAMLRKYADLQLIFVGIDSQLRPLLKAKAADLSDRWKIHPASEIVAMDESPSQALRSKKDSSMRVAIDLVKEGQALACVSAGNTGALMATARFVLKTLPGVDRPAIMTRFPTKSDKPVRVLDLGANVDSSAEQLFQFAVMGSVAAKAVNAIDKPKVALLNIGEEEIKGNEQVKKTAELLEQTDVINYVGFIEGDGIFSGDVDVIVCDGFVGNITLKAVEGILAFLINRTKTSFMRNWLTKLSIVPAYPILKRLKKRLDPRSHNGATLLGLNGIVIKSHGSADEVAYAAAIQEALLEVRKNLPQLIGEQVKTILAADEMA